MEVEVCASMIKLSIIVKNVKVKVFASMVEFGIVVKNVKVKVFASMEKLGMVVRIVKNKNADNLHNTIRVMKFTQKLYPFLRTSTHDAIPATKAITIRLSSCFDVPRGGGSRFRTVS